MKTLADEIKEWPFATLKEILLQTFGISFLTVNESVPRADGHVARPKSAAPPQRTSSASERVRFIYDVAISFAGPQRPLAEAVATAAREAGYDVLYDNFYKEQLWGKDLPVFFDSVYRKEARYCLIFVSTEYRERLWTNHERRSAQARALQERGNDYILPVRVDDAELDGMPPTVGYLSLQEHSIEEITHILIAKLRRDGE